MAHLVMYEDLSLIPRALMSVGACIQSPFWRVEVTRSLGPTGQCNLLDELQVSEKSVYKQTIKTQGKGQLRNDTQVYLPLASICT